MPEPNRLKLLVVTMMYEPDCVGIAAIASDMCKALANRGHDVTVYTTYPYYPEWRLKSKARRWRTQQETIDDVTVRRHRIFVPSNPARLLPRLIHELSFPVSLLKSLFQSKRFDVVIIYCPLIGGVAFGVLRKLLFRDPLWVNIQDIPVGAAKASGMIRSKLLTRAATRVQGSLLNCGDVWSTISHDMFRKLDSMKKPALAMHLCPNWLTGPLREDIRQLPCKIGRTPKQPPRLIYCGTIGKKQGLLAFCKVLSQCEQNFRFRIRGSGCESAAIKRWIDLGNDRRFEFGGLLPQPEFIKAVHEADWFVIPQLSDAGCSFFPSKLIPSIFVGTPILAISDDGGPLLREVKEHGLGVVTSWSKAHSVVDELDRYLHDPAEYAQLQKNCVLRARAYDRDAAMDQFETLLKDVRARHLNRAKKARSFSRNGSVPTM